MILFAVPLFCIAAFLSYLAVKSQDTKLPKLGGIIIPIFGLPWVFGFLFPNLDVPFLGVPFVLLILCSVFALPITLGLVVGALIKRQKLRGRTKAALVSGLICSLILVTLMASTLYKQTVNRNKRIEIRQAYQDLTLEDALGGVAITIPVSPQLYMRYRCSPLDIERFNACNDIKFDPYWRTLPLHARPANAPSLERLVVARLGRQRCQDELRTQGACLRPEIRQDWCARRPDMKGSIWCTNNLKQSIKFEIFRQSDFGIKMDARNWISQDLGSVGTDVMGNAVAIKCNLSRDNLSDRKNRLCRLKFFLEDNIIAEVKIEQFKDEDLEVIATDMFIKTNEFWRAMSSE